MKKYVDVKISMWKRVEFDEDADIKEVITIIQKEGVEEIYNYNLGQRQSETMEETEATLTPEENGGEATVEVFMDDTLLWNNAGHSLEKELL